MKTLLFSNQGLSPSHLGIELEILQTELRAKNDVEILYCKSNLESCFFNASHNILACSICESRTQVFYKELDIDPQRITPLKNLVSSFALPEINIMEDVFNIRYKDYDIGRGIAASYISTHRNYEYQKSDVTFIEEMAIMCANVIDNIELKIKTFNPENIILFNGRFAEQNAIIEVCAKKNITYHTFERSSATGKYKYFKNMLPHSLTHRAAELKRIQKNAPVEEIKRIGEKWFTDRLKGGTGVVQKYLSKQDKGALPDAFDFSKENIAIFVASEDEHAAVKEHQSGIFKTQNEAINTILNHYKNHGSFHFYLRVHPNLRNIESAQMDEINSMKFDNLTIIGPNEKTDTYQLMAASNKVLTFGSATGIEACYGKKASILFGHAYYESIDVCYTPKSYDELYGLLETTSLEAKPQENTFIFGYYQNVIGIPFTNFHEGGKDNSAYNQKPMKRLYPKTILTLFRNLSQFGQWAKMTKIIFKQPLGLGNMFKLNSHVLNNKLK